MLFYQMMMVLLLKLFLHSSSSEYVSRMNEDSKDIYYASGESIEKIDNLPQIDQVKEKDYEI